MSAEGMTFILGKIQGSFLNISYFNGYNTPVNDISCLYNWTVLSFDECIIIYGGRE